MFFQFKVFSRDGNLFMSVVEKKNDINFIALTKEYLTQKLVDFENEY